MKTEEGGHGEEESDGSQFRAGDPGFISYGEGENHKDHGEQEVPEKPKEVLRLLQMLFAVSLW